MGHDDLLFRVHWSGRHRHRVRMAVARTRKSGVRSDQVRIGCESASKIDPPVSLTSDLQVRRKEQVLLMESVSKIRRWVLVEGRSIRSVARTTGLSRNTIRKSPKPRLNHFARVSSLRRPITSSWWVEPARTKPYQLPGRRLHGNLPGGAIALGTTLINNGKKARFFNAVDLINAPSHACKHALPGNGSRNRPTAMQGRSFGNCRRWIASSSQPTLSSANGSRSSVMPR